ncbi:MAG: hypothetical protein WCV85_02410 [Patescibacteria group bacterium]|jgi:hypothetical protein
MGSIEKLLIADAALSRTTAHVFIAHPSPAEERVLGKLGFVAEMQSNDRVNHELLSRLQDFLKAAYYTSTEANPEVAFEHTIQATNRFCSELVGDFGNDWIDRLALVVFVLREDLVLFSDIGRLVGMLVQGRQIVDLFNGVRPSKPNPLKLLSAISSGTLKGDAAILFGTQNLLDYFSIEKIRRTIAEAPMGGAAKHLENILRSDPNHNAFAAVVIQSQTAVYVQPQQSILPRTNIPGAPQRSMDELITRDAKTQELLTPSLWPALKRGSQTILQRGRVFFRAWILHKPTRISPVLERPEDEPVRPANYSAPQERYIRNRPTFGGPRLTHVRHVLFKKIPKFLWERGRSAVAATPKVLSALTRAGRHVQKAPQTLPTLMQERVREVRLLPQRSRLLLLSTGGIAIIFALTLIGIGIQKQRSTKAQAAETAYATIEEKIAEARTTLLYGDEDRAKELLQDAQKTLTGLPQVKGRKAEADAARRSSIATSINDVLTQTRHAISTTPEKIASLPEGKTYTSVTMLGSALFTLDSGSNILYRLPAAGGTAQTTGTFTGATDVQALAGYGSSSVLGLTGSLEIVEQRLGVSSNTRVSLTSPNTNANVVGLATYNTALYTVDIAGNSILRATRSGANFRAAAWLRQTATVSNTVDLAVDGSIYTLAGNGEVQKFTQGNRVQLALSTIDPPLTTATKIAADQTLQNIYILDTAGKRLVVFTKTGKFVNQYTHERFGEVTAFTVNEANQKIYLLVGNEIQTLTIVKRQV